MIAVTDVTLPKPRAFLFDWDNTLVENWRNIQAALNAALADAGRAPYDLDEAKFLARHSAGAIFPKLFGDKAERARTIFYAHFTANHLAGLNIMAGANSLIGFLSEKKIPLAIVSNKKGDLLRREVDHLGWTEKFVTIVGAQDAQADKPDPAPVYLALKNLGINPGGDIWYIGDTDIDMRTAIASRCTPILIGEGPSDPALLENCQPALKCLNCSDFEGFVRNHWNTISN